jgi:hypothetical protein
MPFWQNLGVGTPEPLCCWMQALQGGVSDAGEQQQQLLAQSPLAKAMGLGGSLPGGPCGSPVPVLL